MQVTCLGCRLVVEVDVSVSPPPGGWACPSCHAILTIPASRSSAQGPTPEMEAWLRQQLDALRTEMSSSLVPPAGAWPGVAGRASRRRPSGLARLALVVEGDPALGEALAASLRSMGYQTEILTSAKAALRRMSTSDPEVVLVDDALDGEPHGGIKVIEWLNSQPGPRRRKIFAAFVSPDHRTLDTGSAFICGANLTINRSDAGRLEEVLHKGIAERDELYRTFMEVTDEVQG